MLVVDSAAGAWFDTTPAALPDLLRPGDLLVINDAATLPASLRGTVRGAAIELRLVTAPLPGEDTWLAVLFGEGDWRTRTEDRPAPPDVASGDRLEFAGLAATVVAIEPASPRLLRVRFDREGDALYAALYAIGRPIQYSYLADDVPLDAFQTAFAGPPWAMEMPSAARPLRWAQILEARRRGIEVRALTHAAGVSATGDDALDRLLPFPERYAIPDATADAVLATRARGGRVVAVGTTVVRALEGWARSGERAGVTDLVLDAGVPLRVVDAMLTGMHAPGESHWRVLAAFAPPALLDPVCRHAVAHGYLAHEFGDATLFLPGAALSAARNAA
jgi:S-adenosylmethionine:tRNA ribosyltransferase-isomerase